MPQPRRSPPGSPRAFARARSIGPALPARRLRPREPDRTRRRGEQILAARWTALPPRGSPSLQPARRVDRGVGQDTVGAGALEADQALHHRPLAVEPAIL